MLRSQTSNIWNLNLSDGLGADMMRSTIAHVLFLLMAVAVGLLIACFFCRVVLNVIIVFGLVMRQLGNRVRFGARMTLDEIRKEADPIHMAQLLRYQLGWSPGRIAAELNRWGIRNHDLPWSENDVGQAVKRI